MTKKELVKKVAAQTGVTKKDTEMMVEAIAKVIANSLTEGESVRLPSFGTFHVGTVAETTRYNALTGGQKTYPEHKRVRFKPSKDLREQLNS